jgi:hypothetical protein
MVPGGGMGGVHLVQSPKIAGMRRSAESATQHARSS